jgi:hypothetical protein
MSEPAQTEALAEMRKMFPSLSDVSIRATMARVAKHVEECRAKSEGDEGWRDQMVNEFRDKRGEKHQPRRDRSQDSAGVPRN